MRTRKRQPKNTGRRALMRYRQPKLNEKDKSEIIDLFNLSPMKVTEIAEAYGLSRVTIYRWMWELDKVQNGNV